MNTHTLCFAKKSFQISFKKYGLFKRKKAHIFLKLDKCYLWPWLSILITYVYLFATAYIYYGVLLTVQVDFIGLFTHKQPLQSEWPNEQNPFFFKLNFYVLWPWTWPSHLNMFILLNLAFLCCVDMWPFQKRLKLNQTKNY